MLDKAKEFFVGSIAASADLTESLTKNQVLFGGFFGQVQQFAEGAVGALGQSQAQALEATGVFGNLFRAVKIGPQAAAEMSTTLTALASDLASFNNASVDDALIALRSGLVGETEPLKRFGVNLNEATLQAKALELGLDDGKGVLDASTKAHAAYALILEQTTLAQGDFARTSGGLANQQRILAAQTTELQTKLGNLLAPAVTKLVTFINTKGLPGIESFARAMGDRLGPTVETVGRVFGEIGGGIRAFFATFASGEDDLTSSGLPGFFERLGQVARGVWDELAPIGEALQEVGVALGALFQGSAGDAVGTLEGMGPGFGIIGDAAKTLAAIISEILQGALGIFSDVLGVLAENLDLTTDAVWAGVAAWGAYKVALISAQVIDGVGDAVRGLAAQMAIARVQTQLFTGTSVLGNLVTNVTGLGGAATAATGPVSKFAGSAGGLSGALNFIPKHPIALAVAAAAAAVIVAYTKFEPFRKVVNAVGEAIGRAAVWVGQIVAALATLNFDKVGEMLSDLGEDLGGFFATLGPLVLDGITAAFSAVVSWITGSLGPWLGDALRSIASIWWTWITDTLPTALVQLGLWLGQLGQWIVGTAVPWLAGKALELGGALLSFIGEAIAAAPGRLGELLGTLVAWALNTVVALPGILKDLALAVWDWIGPAIKVGADKLWDLGYSITRWIFVDLPIVIGQAAVDAAKTIGPAFWSWITDTIAAAPEFLGGIVDVLEEFFRDLPNNIGDFITSGLPDLGRAGAGLGRAILEGIGEFFTSGLPDLVRSGGRIIGAIIEGLEAAVGTLIEKGGEFIGGFVKGLTDNLGEDTKNALGAIFVDLPRFIGDGLLGLGDTLIGWVVDGFLAVVTEGPALVLDLLEWWAGIPLEILGALGDLGLTLAGWVAAAVSWVVTSGPQLLLNLLLWVAGIQWQILGALGDLGLLLLGWVGGAFQWVIDNGPGLLANLLAWAAGIPGAIIGAIGDLGAFLIFTVWLPALTAVYDFVVGKLGELVSFFTGLPGMLANAAGDLFGWVTESFRAALNSVIGLWNGLRIPEFDIGPWEVPTSPWTTQSVGPFTIGGIDFPDIPQLARGALIKASPGQGTVARIGEGVRDELVAPLPPGFMDAMASIAGGGGAGGGALLEVRGNLVLGDKPQESMTALTNTLRGITYRGAP